jgi:SAM-dependent methyltransferase
LAAFHDRGEDPSVTIRNDFGPTEEVRASLFFRGEDSFEEWELIALAQCGRRVLDVGAGVGAHALVLQARGHEVTALEPIAEAVRIMRERGVLSVREGTMVDLPSTPRYDTVILLMNGSMIAETLSGLDGLLVAVGGVLEPDGVFVLDSTDLLQATYAGSERNLTTDSAADSEPEPEPDAPIEIDSGAESDTETADDGRYVGELHYQLSVGDHTGDVFPQLFVDPATLKERAGLAGWSTEVIWSGSGGHYLARLRRQAYLNRR